MKSPSARRHSGSLRSLAREIIGKKDFHEVFVTCSYTTCEQRDVKGLYAKARAGEIKHFTGKDSTFEPPADAAPADLTLDTDIRSESECLQALIDFIDKHIGLEAR